MRACPTIRTQLLRGAIAAAALIAAYFAYAQMPLLSYALIGVSLFAMRGCPACWVAGMCDAVRARKPAAPVPPESKTE
ncbi:MAG TPA: hypothetical protein VEF76_07605 [Patescibacteria group bacterium]|nr:hypothetical protein [Patescibacteria group bacterium]